MEASKELGDPRQASVRRDKVDVAEHERRFGPELSWSVGIEQLSGDLVTVVETESLVNVTEQELLL